MNKKNYFKPNPCFDATVKAYLNMIATTLQSGTVRSYSISLKCFIGFLSQQYPGLTRLSDLQRSPHIEEWLPYLTANGLSKGTRYLRILHLRKFFEDIYEWGWKDVPAVELITTKDLPKIDKYLPKPIAPEDDRILQKTLKSTNSLFSQALFLLRKTGMRIGELRDLELNCLQKTPEGDYVLHVPIGKLHTQRIIPVDSETVEAINRIIKLRGQFLPISHPRTGQPTQFLLVRSHSWQRPSYTGLRNQLLSAAKSAGIKPVNPHRLRHTYATELLRCGIALPALMKLLGHNDIDMTLNYADVSQLDVRKAYFAAVEKGNSLALMSKSADNENAINNPDFIFNGINVLLTKLRSIQKDSADLTCRKKLLRIADRLSRVYRDLEATLKG